jgi:hypothetical protein
VTQACSTARAQAVGTIHLLSQWNQHFLTLQPTSGRRRSRPRNFYSTPESGLGIPIEKASSHEGNKCRNCVRVQQHQKMNQTRIALQSSENKTAIGTIATKIF